MKTRIHAGSDVAKIGAWDASQPLPPISEPWGGEYTQTLDRDAAEGNLFLIKMGGDGSGPIDIFVDEDPPPSLLNKMRTFDGEFLLRVPSGKLLVAGVEAYRTSNTDAVDERGIATIPSGDYAIKCHEWRNPETGGFPTRAEFEKAIGAEEYSYYRRVQKIGCLGYALFLLLPALRFLFSVGWGLGLTITLGAVAGFFYWHQESLKGNERYQRINRAVNEAARNMETPSLVLQLRKVTDPTALKGGSVKVD
jgi:hypothetical protein